MKIWVTRDEGDIISLWDIRPTKCPVKGYNLSAKQEQNECEWAEVVGTFVFKKLFGFTPRKGSCKQYDLTLKEI